MKKLAIDIGIVHLALVYAEVSDNIEYIISCSLINLTDYAECSDVTCTIKHNKRIATYMRHLFKEYTIFQESDKIIIEQQPPLGITCVEQIICYEFPDKTELISPNSMHCYFGIGHLEYEQRKIMTIKIAEEYLENFDNYKNAIRKHDLSDAVCILIYYLSSMRTKMLESAQEERNRNITKTFSKNIEQFIYEE